LISFSRSNGAYPYGELTQGADGNFYGTTSEGGIGYGTVFQMSTSGALTSVISFTGTNGANPFVAMTLGRDGNLYGTTTAGGSGGGGVIFRLTMPPTILRLTRVGPTSIVTFNTMAGATYRLRYNDQLDPPVITWPFVDTILNGTGSPQSLTDMNSPPYRFYRLERNP
jgi:uncharacterized repeat protein (TIGR03803 family)